MLFEDPDGFALAKKAQVPGGFLGTPGLGVPEEPGLALPGEGTSSLSGPYELRGPGGERYRLARPEQVVHIGRQPDNDLVLADKSVSRKHASVRLHQGQVEVRDNGSHRGTSVSGRRVAGGWHPVKPGDILLVGSYPLTLDRPATPAVAPPAPQTLTLEQLRQQAQAVSLDVKAVYLDVLARATSSFGASPGIVRLPEGLPTLIIPDLHAQRDYLLDALLWEDGFARLAEGRLNVLCLGDGMHSEGRAKDRWRQAELDHQQGRPSPAMEQEAVESFGLMKMVMDLKLAFPEHFHYLRGNHDEIRDPRRQVFKFTRVGESELLRDFAQRRLGGDFVERWSELERSLPLLAVGDGFVASHAAPERDLTRPEIESRAESAFTALCWTNNLRWGESRLESLRANLAMLERPPETPWVIGHCKVDNALYRSQLGGQLIQINPLRGKVVALVPASGGFIAERDVRSL